MNLSPDDLSRRRLRRAVYCALIVTSTAAMVGRAWTVKSSLGATAMLSANDRSRWCTIRALVDEGTYRIDGIIFSRNGRRDRHWYTIDMVQHKGRDGKQHYYSSKPPLLPTLLAGKYWLVKTITGATLAERPFYVVRLMLITTNILPLVLYFVLLAWLVERLGQTDWGRMFVMAAATWGTFLTTFAVTINNHLPAAISALIAVCAALPVWREGERRWRYFAAAGLFAAFSAANELPSLALLAVLAAGLFWRSPRGTLVAFVPAAAVVAAGFFLTNYLAHNSWRPPYAHRKDGPVLATLPPSSEQALGRADVAADLAQGLAGSGIELAADASLAVATENERWLLWDPANQRRFAIVRSGGGFDVRASDNWYEYEKSYWLPANRRGVDRGEPSRAVYAFHVLIGHRGILSLTPIWLLSVAGIGIWGWGRDFKMQAFAAVVAALTIVCLAFYILRPLADRNYGGVSCGFRWMFWLIPMWLICLQPAADAVASRRPWRWVAWGLLFVSVVSASYAGVNPWSHSWIFDYWTNLGWIEY